MELSCSWMVGSHRFDATGDDKKRAGGSMSKWVDSLECCNTRTVATGIVETVVACLFILMMAA
jgi:hypothetical protein